MQIVKHSPSYLLIVFTCVSSCSDQLTGRGSQSEFSKILLAVTFDLLSILDTNLAT